MIGAGFVCALALLLTAGTAYGQSPPPKPSLSPGSELPPSMDEVLNRPKLAPGQGELQGYWVAGCGEKGPACDESLSKKAGQMWAKVRKCWQPQTRPPLKTVVSTAIRFGENGRSAPPPDPKKTIVSISFRLDQAGKLAAKPVANKAEATAATPDMIASVIAAVEQCQPYDMPSNISHDQWKDVFVRVGIEFTANPQVGQSRP